MAKVNLQRRAEIGRERSERTRAGLLAAARALFAERRMEAVSVDDIIAKAGVAKGTFYYHFDDMNAITDAVGREIAADLARALAALRMPLLSPMARIARAVDAFLRRAAADKDWARLLARTAAAAPRSAIPNRPDLIDDLKLAQASGLLRLSNVELAADLVLAMVLEATMAMCEGADAEIVIPEMISAVLRTVGIAPAAAEKIVQQVRALPMPPWVPAPG